MKRWAGFTLVEIIIVMAIIAIIAVIAVPNIIEARKFANQGSAVASLRAIGAGQTMFHQADKEQDQNFDFGTLQELSDTLLIDSILGSGTKSGYLFQAEYTLNTSRFLWFAVANPALGAVTGDLYFATNHRGLVFFTFAGSIAMNNVDAEFATDLLPLNRQ
jgi:prepilin-type N-terminal cleavage/methylation domain-containing protein